MVYEECLGAKLNMSVSYLTSSSLRLEPEPIRVGVIGVGNMGQHHARVLGLLKNVELVGISDINVDRGVNTASQYGVRFFEDYRNLLPHVDAVCIAVPTRLHYSVGMTCLKVGIHVLIEKPIAHVVRGLSSFLDRVDELGRKVFVACNMRFHPGVSSLDSTSFACLHHKMRLSNRNLLANIQFGWFSLQNDIQIIPEELQNHLRVIPESPLELSQNNLRIITSVIPESL